MPKLPTKQVKAKKKPQKKSTQNAPRTGPVTTYAREENPRPIATAPSSKLSKALVPAVCGLVDPFCVHARGAKFPDESNTRTLAWSFHSRYTLTSDGAGSSGTLFLPGFTFVPFVDSFSVTTAGILNSNIQVVNAQAIAGVTSYRIVSAGFRLRRVGAPLNASGGVHIRMLGDLLGTNIATVDGLSYSRAEALDIAYQDANTVSVIIPHSAQPAQLFYQPISAALTGVSAWTAPGFTPVSIVILGAQAAVMVAEIEYFVHYELLFDDSSAMTMLATPPATPNPIVQAAAKSLTSAAKSIFTEGVEAVGGFIERKAKTAIASLIASTVMKRPMIVDVD